MLFTDPIFLFLFLPATLVACHVARQRFDATAALTVLFLASCLFYVGWGTDYLLMLLLSILVNWVCAHTILTLADGRQTLRRNVLICGQLFNFSMLIWFKYSFYFFHFAEGSAALSAGSIAIPIGISFYTFQQAAFLQDAKQRERSVVEFLGAEGRSRHLWRGFIRYAGFVAFFPQLVIGPIVFMKEFAPQIAREQFGRISKTNLEIGIFLIVVGLFKKVVIADNLDIIASPIFSAAASGHNMNLLQAWSASIGYYGQLYFDFSGYSDMALGAARVFGITLPINFYSPLKAASISDFYKRWHITLTRAIARFVYTPLSLNGTRFALNRIRWPALRRFPIIWVPLLLNFEVIALWHGATPTFMLFGLIHGFWYVLDVEIRKFSIWKSWATNTTEGFRRHLGQVIFTLPMIICFCLFRADSIGTWVSLLKSMFSVHLFDMDSVDQRMLLEFAQVFGAVCFCWLLPNAYQMAKEFGPGLYTWTYAPGAGLSRIICWKPNFFWGVTLSAAALVALLFVGRLPPFLYLGF